jgi:hypothetical protein
MILGEKKINEHKMYFDLLYNLFFSEILLILGRIQKYVIKNVMFSR